MVKSEIPLIWTLEVFVLENLTEAKGTCEIPHLQIAIASDDM